MLASRGQLTEVPKEYNPLLFFFKFQGIDIELEKEFLNNIVLEDVLNKCEKGIKESRKALVKLIYPDAEDESETLTQEAQRRLTGDSKIIKMGVEQGAKLTPEQVQRMLNGN